MKPQRRRTTKIIAFTLISGGLLLWGTQLYRENIVFFITPSELMSQQNKRPQTSYKVGGFVQEGSIKKIDSNTIQFKIADHINTNNPQQMVTVQYKGILPNLFSENQQVILQGSYQNSLFKANIVLSKHDEYYKK